MIKPAQCHYSTLHMHRSETVLSKEARKKDAVHTLQMQPAWMGMLFSDRGNSVSRKKSLCDAGYLCSVRFGSERELTKSQPGWAGEKVSLSGQSGRWDDI